MDPKTTYIAIVNLVEAVRPIGAGLEAAIAVVGAISVLIALIPAIRAYAGKALAVLATFLVAGEVLLGWMHWRLYDLMLVVEPSTGLTTGHVAAPLWIESEKLYVWALLVAVMGLCMRRQRDELMPGALFGAGVLAVGGTLLSKPFSNPLPNLLSQYVGYLQSLAAGGMTAEGAFQGMESARQFYYNAWFMWVHPPLLFFSYGALVISFVATLLMIRHRHSAYETTAYRWARLGYLSLTAGMLLGFPWALMSWQGEAWWWSGKVNMSIMMWVLYTAYLHARLYLRTRGMWKAVAAVAVISFLILVLTYVATYVVPGAHSYASAEMGTAIAALGDAAGAISGAGA
ncbi:MAG: cytochrome c biogenesis protein CcsA [Coriobacteriia bacterium]|nr:cytochrome c biogenesis protein CcsA [Coriobacteriia bacterium]